MPDLDYPIHILWQLVFICLASLMMLGLIYLCVIVIGGIYQEITGRRKERW